MKTRVIWFLTGVLTACLVWSLLCYIPKDLTKKWPSSIRDLSPESMLWFRSALVRNIGCYTFCVPFDQKNASALLMTHGNCYPELIILDDDNNGVPDSIEVIGTGHQTISVNMDNDGKLKGYSVTIGSSLNPESVTLVDSDLNGEFDMRIGPGDKVSSDDPGQP